MNKSKLQEMIIKHLLKDGAIEIILPDGLTLEIGITQEGCDGQLHKVKDYCWLTASHKDRTVAIDSYNLGLSFSEIADTLLLEDMDLKEDGTKAKFMTVC